MARPPHHTSLGATWQVWKPDIGDEDPQTVSPAIQQSAETKMCDGALTAFRRCVRGIAMSGPLQVRDLPISPHIAPHRTTSPHISPYLTFAMSGQLQAYNQHEEIVKFFDGNYSTKIGYGLHYGWAIEGAVGTNIKIDCSYLSPNVNLAARLESATKMYRLAAHAQMPSLAVATPLATSSPPSS